ncbi:6711_t:CDS:2 [Acaulospora colombiana]|uniref:6711_t:CDS:1 n=1 Tax=Acaulospora colombiana TaxID=27376 RepID=A0ACA9KQB7_9GLOM|nr:6711_t:CDS:2 [Acaulospora colombiana]
MNTLLIESLLYITDIKNNKKNNVYINNQEPDKKNIEGINNQEPNKKNIEDKGPNKNNNENINNKGLNKNNNENINNEGPIKNNSENINNKGPIRKNIGNINNEGPIRKNIGNINNEGPIRKNIENINNEGPIGKNIENRELDVEEGNKKRKFSSIDNSELRSEINRLHKKIIESKDAEKLEIVERKEKEKQEIMENMNTKIQEYRQKLENHGRLENLRNIRGFIESIRSKPVSFSEPLDKALNTLSQNKDFVDFLKRSCDDNDIRLGDVQSCIGALYHTVSKHFHGHDKEVVIDESSWVPNEIFSLGIIFTYFGVPWSYRGANGTAEKFPYRI